MPGTEPRRAAAGWSKLEAALPRNARSTTDQIWMSPKKVNRLNTTANPGETLCVTPKDAARFEAVGQHAARRHEDKKAQA